MAIPFDTIKAQLKADSIVIPDLILEIILRKIEKIRPCLEGAGLDEDDIDLLTWLLVQLLVAVNADTRVTSQRAQSGAGRSFSYAEIGDRYRALTGQIYLIDKTGCTAGLIPPNPDDEGNCGLWVSPGVCP